MRLLLTLSLSFLLLFMVGCPASNEGNTTNTGAENTADNNGNTADANSNSADANSGESGDAKDIVAVAGGNDDFETLVTAVKAAELVETLQGDGPFTVFAPTNAAFEKIDKATLDDLLKPENKDKLKGILTYHVVSGKLDASAVADAIKKGDGKATLKTVQGEEITASLDGENVVITDAKGGKSTVAKTDVMASNGVIHVIDTVLMPSK